MSWFAGYLRSSVGAKHVMALTGLGLLLFAIIHMIGHLQMFGGPSMYNAYANFLQNLWEVKWPVRAGLLALLLIHVVVAIGLVARNRAARGPVGYVKFKGRTSSIAGRTMAWTGLVVFAFLAFHILHFTAGQIQPEYFHLPQNGGTDVRAGGAYAMFVHGFRQPWVYGIYLVGVALLSSHLGHGSSSWLQSLGLRHPKYPADKIGPAIGVFLFVGYMVPPTAVLLGAIR
ncbi:MAG: succinate dehydrogenase cytochrome b subunit [Kofleriaceae bacterium]